MATDKYISVGKLRKPHGISGAFGFLLNRELKSLKKIPPHFFLEVKGNYLPYFIQNIELQDIQTGYLTFEEISNREDAKLLSSSDLYLPEKDIKQYFKKDADDLSTYIGYTVFDKEKGEIGIIDDVLDLPLQVMANVKTANGEFMIPITEELIESIDDKKKKIVFIIPEGLMEL